MPHILITEKGKRVKIDMSKDVCLYSAPHNPPNTGTAYTRGTDLYAHKARSGRWYYYKHDWSMWQGEEDSTYLIDRVEAIEFLQRKASSNGWDELDDGEIERIVKHFGEDVFSENA